MQREPSLHIKRSDLEKVLKRLSIDDSRALSLAIIKLGKGYTVSNRAVVVDTKYAEKKIIKQNHSDSSNILHFYTIYSMIVKSTHQFTPKRLKEKDSRLMSIVSQVLVDALDFCFLFNLETSEGYKIYLRIGLEKNPQITYLLGKIESIQTTYKAELEYGNGSKGTDKLYKQYQETMLSYTGIDYSLKSPTVLAKFKKAAAWCDNTGVDYKHFILALFEGLEWKKGIPSPSMFLSDYGIQLVYQYIGNNPSPDNDGFTSINLKDIMK